MEYLVSVDDGRGHRFLAKRDDGKGLLTSARCADCCGGPSDCANVRRYNRCPTTPDNEGCQSDPDHLWMCEYPQFVLAGTIQEGNACYSKTDIIIPIADMPPGDRLLTVPYADMGSCANPNCTFCQHYYLAEPCPGQLNPPRVFVLTEWVPTPTPGQDCAGFGYADRCYTIRPGQRYSRAEAEASGIIADVRPGFDFKCCTCVAGCQDNPLPDFADCGLGLRTLNLRCCCSDEWTASISYNRTVTQIDTTSPAGRFQRVEHYGGTVMITNQTPVDQIPTVPGYISQQSPGFPDFYQEGTEAVPWGGACPVLPPFPSTPGFCPAGGPWIRGNPATGEYEQVVRADSYVTCNSARINYVYRFYAAGQTEPRIENVYNWQATVRHTGRCGGGCGQASGQSDPAGRILAAAQGTATAGPLQAVPRKDWPAWAKGIALLRNKADEGVGSTVQRVIGDTASGAFKAWYRAIFGQDCGCGGRRTLWDTMYPYEATP